MSITVYYGDQTKEFELDPVGGSCTRSDSSSSTPVYNASLAVDNCVFGFVEVVTTVNEEE